MSASLGAHRYLASAGGICATARPTAAREVVETANHRHLARTIRVVDSTDAAIDLANDTE